jgi:hypothetical protein
MTIPSAVGAALFCSATQKNIFRNCRFRLTRTSFTQEEEKMQYLVLIYEDEKRFANGYPEDEFAEYGAFGKKHASAIKGGNALQPTPTAKTVRVRDTKVLTTDGPFAETKEQLGGYYLIEAASIDEAASIATGIPAVRYGSVEVRPIMVFS